MKETSKDHSVKESGIDELAKENPTNTCHCNTVSKQADGQSSYSCNCHDSHEGCKCHDHTDTATTCTCVTQKSQHDHHHYCGCGCCHGEQGHESYHVHEGFSIQFEGEFPCDVPTLWDYLTENDLLQQWYPELNFESLQPGGRLVYHYQDGGYETMMVMDVEPNQLLSYTWDTNTVSFELREQSSQITELVFTEWISQVTDFTPKDLTAWIVGLQRLALLLEKKDLGDREAMFEKYLPQVEQLLENKAAEFE